MFVQSSSPLRKEKGKKKFSISTSSFSFPCWVWCKKKSCGFSAGSSSGRPFGPVGGDRSSRRWFRPDRLRLLEHVAVDVGHGGVPLGPEEGEPNRLERVLLDQGGGRPEAILERGLVFHLNLTVFLLKEHKHKAVQVGAASWVGWDVLQNCGSFRGVGVLLSAWDVRSIEKKKEGKKKKN